MSSGNRQTMLLLAAALLVEGIMNGKGVLGSGVDFSASNWITHFLSDILISLHMTWWYWFGSLLRKAPSNGRNCCQFLVAFHFMGLWYRGLVQPTRVFIRKILTSVKSLPRYRRNVKSNQNQAFRIVQDWVLLCTGLYLEFMAFLLWHCVSLIPQLTHWEPKCATVISHWGVCQPHLLYVWNIGPFLPPVWCLSQPLRKTKPNMWIKHNAIMGGFSKTER